MNEASFTIPSTRPSIRSVRLAEWVRRIHFLDDMLALVIAYKLAFASRFPGASSAILEGSPVFDSAYAGVYFRRAPVYLLLCASVLFLCYSLLGMYDGHRRIRRTPLLWNALVGNGIVIGVVAVYLFFSKSMWHMRGFIPLVLLINIPMTVIMRRLTHVVLDRARRRHPSLRLRTLLIGCGDEADELSRRAARGRLKGGEIVAHVAAPRTIGEARERLPALLEDRIDAVLLADRSLPTDLIMEVVRICACQNKSVKAVSPRFLELRNPFGGADEVEGIPIVHFDAPGFSTTDTCCRRLVSRLAAAVLLLPFALLHAVVALLIRLDSPGPVLFVQDRVGLHGRIFRMFKYRTMCADAEARKDALRAENEADGALFKMRNDPRVTRFGRFLRRTSIDELPQIINIFRGDMRFVGPRPLPASDLQGYANTWYFMRQSCSPGVTCIWQVAGRSHLGFEEMCLLDIWYVLNRNWMLDAWIVARTAWVVAFGSGAY